MEFEKVRDIIVETLGCDAEQVKPEATLSEDLGADSLADVGSLKTVGDILAYLEAHKN